MLDSFEIITASGVVLWSRSYSFVSPAVVNKFITDVFIEENAAGAVSKEDAASSSSHAPYLADQYAVKWAFVKDLGIMFVAVYKSLLHLSWIDKLIDNIKTLFISLYGDQLTIPNTTLFECSRFDNYFDQQMNELEGGALPDALAEKRALKPPIAAAAAATTTTADSSPAVSPPTSRPSTAHGATTTATQNSPPGKISRRARKAKHAAVAGGGGGGTPSYSSDEATVARVAHKQKDGKAKTAKKGRKWGPDGIADEEDDIQLDYSIIEVPKEGGGGGGGAGERAAGLEQIDASTWGSKTSQGQFVLKDLDLDLDLDNEVHSILADAAADKKAAAAASSRAKEDGTGGLLDMGLSTIGGLFRNMVGGKTLTRQDLDKAMKGMEDHLLRKNVAREAAVRLCESVEADLVGVRTGNFESTNARVKTALEAALTKMLTPTSSLDLLREIDAVTAPPATSLRKPRPYVISIVGVNGVGKSTNLSKICYFLLQNRYRVLIAAGDTFRSGAVEQLAVHVRNLQELTARDHNGAAVELYQRGYGKDAAAVAKDAVAAAAQQGFDVVLIDTAGRRHNDQRLMSSLEKFAKLAQPDKILMVGEALVGTDSVAQARSFNSAFGGSRTLDGFIISKCDTVGGMVGTLVSLVHATNVPILFVGVGQHYSDLRNFSVKWAVDRLLSND